MFIPIFGHPTGFEMKFSEEFEGKCLLVDPLTLHRHLKHDRKPQLDEAFFCTRSKLRKAGKQWLVYFFYKNGILKHKCSGVKRTIFPSEM